MTETCTFESFGLAEGLLQALGEIGFKTPSPIQQEVIPHILAGKDLVGQAQTGTGKTGAFGLPALHRLQQTPGAQMLVMAPTRELAKQVGDELYRFGRYLGIKTALICGGKAFKGQVESLQNGVQVVVATPGRLLDLLESGSFPQFRPSIVVLDEADEMLDMGFLDDIQKIFSFLPAKRQTLLFSATMPQAIQRLAQQILCDPVTIKMGQNERVNRDIEQFYYVIREEERDHAIMRLIDYENPEKAIIFCRTKRDVERLAHFLIGAGYSARGLHGDMEQPQREDAIRHFRSEHLRFLVATDVAARGLSVAEVSHVFNYHPPFDPHSYLHRIGRTGRAGNKGMAGTFLTPRERRDFQHFERILGTRMQQRELPTLREVKTAKRQRLADQVMMQSIHEEADQMLRLMQSEELSTVASRLISLLLSQQAVLGPEQIGLGREQPFERRRPEGGRPFRTATQGRPSRPFKHAKPPHAAAKFRVKG